MWCRCHNSAGVTRDQQEDNPGGNEVRRFGRSRGTTFALCGVLLMAAIGAEASRWGRETASAPPTPPAVRTLGQEQVVLTPRSASRIEMPRGVPAAHASALAALPGDDLLAFWWAGERESGADVKVYVARWDDGRWSAPRPVVDRDTLGDALGFAVRRIGNPSAWVAPDGRVHLYVVATGLGGWAASRIVHLVSADEGRSFDVQRVLPMSPLFNTSALVRTSPVGAADGGWLLPAYFELGNKYPMLVSFDEDGDPRWITRIGSLTTALQPALVAVSGREMRALMRDHGDDRRLQQAVSRDGGEHWEDLPASGLANHDSSVAALRLRDGGFVMLHNEQLDTAASPRQWLRLSVSGDAASWAPGVDVLKGLPGDEFSYPSVQQVGRELHVTYTFQRQAIAHHVYDISYARTER